MLCYFYLQSAVTGNQTKHITTKGLFRHITEQKSIEDLEFAIGQTQQNLG